MDAKKVANYLSKLRDTTGLTYEVIAEKSEMSESTVKNLCTGKTEDPRLKTVAPIVFALGGSLDEMYTGQSKDAVKEISINSIKEIYEQQLLEITKINETHISNIRSHYEQHRDDTISNFERLLTEKENQTKLFKRLSIICFGIACVGFAILIGLLILEVSNPNLGWIKF